MTIFIWIIYAFWFVLIAYLIFSAMGVKPETQEHLAQSFGLLLAIIVAFLLPHLPIFHFVNFAPRELCRKQYRRDPMRRRYRLSRLGETASRQKLEPDRCRKKRT